jgi:ABC-type uncharacterized transport system ATPase subunit
MNDTSHEVAQGSHHLGGVAPTALSAHNIVKRFPGVLANDNVDFDVRAGEVHTLLGENGGRKKHACRNVVRPVSTRLWLSFA